MNSSQNIREATPGDSAEIARLCVELGYPVSPAEIESRIKSIQRAGNRLIALVVGPESTLLGWVAAEHRLLLESGERVEIVGLVVDSSARRKGVGKTLVAAAEDWASSRGISTVSVRSNVARNTSHQFYEGIGYERTKTQHAYTKKLCAD
ncbi:MAG: GNAT family N-acetyltransferase [Woeseiaceae bacterium]|nr:GNAT family N-acetyltransferase [Woeseiaceae bacterium]